MTKTCSSWRETSLQGRRNLQNPPPFYCESEQFAGLQLDRCKVLIHWSSLGFDSKWSVCHQVINFWPGCRDLLDEWISNNPNCNQTEVFREKICWWISPRFLSEWTVRCETFTCKNFHFWSLRTAKSTLHSLQNRCRWNWNHHHQGNWHTNKNTGTFLTL